jgi:hypothetical protein
MSTRDPMHDFDFLHGSWNVAHRRLRHRLVGSDDWQEFPGTGTCWPLLGGMGNVDDNDMPALGVRGVSFRLYDPARREWSIRWVSSRDGVLGPPLIGGFAEGIGEFRGEDLQGGRKVAVTFRWSLRDAAHPLWEQAFSADDGRRWETNWVMRFTRAG